MEYLEKQGLTIQLLKERGFLYAVRKCSLTYKSPARYGDTIRCEAELIKVTAAQLIFNQKIYEKFTRRLLVEAEITLVSLNHDFKPTPIPEDIKSHFPTLIRQLN